MSEMKEKFLKEYAKPAFEIEKVELVFELFEEYATVHNTMVFHRRDKDTHELRLDALDLELLSVEMDGFELDSKHYIVEDEYLVIKDVLDHFTLKIINKIYPQNNTELEGLYKSGSIFCTQNEPEGFRRITPYLDRPDVMSVFTTTIIADKKRYPILLSNGNKMQCHESFDTKHGVTWHDPHPKPSYLFALVAGDLGVVSDSFTTMSGNEVALNIYCDLGNESKCYHAMDSLKKAMAWDEQNYGREYDLDYYNIVAVDSFNMGAMENKGLNIFNSAYVLADSDTATDANFMGIESVIAHEYFHNWTGNRITCRDWFQLTLKEGLTVFRDQCFSADINSAEVQRIDDVKALRERQFVEDASATSHPIQPKSYISMNNFYTATVYEKGAEVIRMIHTLLGKEKYRKATDLYFERFDGQAVTTEDFLWAMEQGGECDLEQFRLWYHQSGTPKLKVEENFVDGKYTLRLTQVVLKSVDGKEQKPYYYPLKIALYNSEDGVLEHEDMLIISKESEEFVFEGYGSKPVLSINRDFSAPIIVEQEDVNYPFLMKYDTNSFTQYEAAQNFALVTLETMMDSGEISQEYISAFGALLKLDVDLSYKALLLELPSISVLMQRQNVVHIDLICSVRSRLLKVLATTYKTQLLELYEKNHIQTDTSIERESIAKRAIKNRALRLLSYGDDKMFIELSYKQYKASQTMTDKIVAFDILQNTDATYAEEAREDFYHRYKDNTLVMNKYFASLASVDKEDVLENVKKLQNDEVYDEKVPNLVRALLGSFTRNYKYFHAKDGSGYKFIAQKIIEIDRFNPQVASALSGAFKTYNKMDNSSKKMIKRELECVVSTQSISKNTFEIINKILTL